MPSYANTFLIALCITFFASLATNTYGDQHASLQTDESNKPVLTDLDKNALNELAGSRQWLDLLHYHDVGLVGDDGSQVDDQSFFLSAEGSKNPMAELVATLQAFSPENEEAVAHQCRFPARFSWISSELGSHYFKKAPCPEFEKWRDEVAADGLTLIFPAAYLNSPSSMFGHTLMRIDSKNHKSELLSYSINYAANADPNDNELVFSYKGLTGGYPGVFSVLPYYEKVKEYNYLESRDVWEYELDISPQELSLFVEHIWEIKETHFDYYFFTENCSYHLLTLLDASSNRFELSKEFSTNVIPADTVRVLNEQGLIKKARFRPSMQTTLKHRMRSTDTSTEELAVRLVDESASTPQAILSSSPANDREQAQSLELAVALARYRAKEQKEQSQFYNRRSIKLLSARSKLGEEESFSETPTPTTRDDEGHRSHRWLMRAGHDSEGNYLGLDLRMSYHDFLDSISGYIPGAQLEIIHFRFKAYSSDESVQLEQFRAIDIASLSPRNTFLKPISWFVSTGLERNLYQADELMPYLRAGPGLTYDLVDSPNASILMSGLLSTRLYADNDIAKGYSFESGPKLQLTIQNPGFNTVASWERHYRISGTDIDQSTTSLGVGIPLNRTLSTRLTAKYNEVNNTFGSRIYDVAGEAALAWYF